MFLIHHKNKHLRGVFFFFFSLFLDIWHLTQTLPSVVTETTVTWTLGLTPISYDAVGYSDAVWVQGVVCESI